MINLKEDAEFLFRSPIIPIEESQRKEEEFLKCLRELAEKNPPNNDYTCKNDDPLWRELSERYLSVKSQLKELESLEKEYRQALIHLSGEENCEGGGLKLTKIKKKGSINYLSIPELNDIDLELFRSDPIEYWKIQKEEEI